MAPVLRRPSNYAVGGIGHESDHHIDSAPSQRRMYACGQTSVRQFEQTLWATEGLLLAGTITRMAWGHESPERSTIVLTSVGMLPASLIVPQAKNNNLYGVLRDNSDIIISVVRRY